MIIPAKGLELSSVSSPSWRGGSRKPMHIYI